MGAVSLLPEFVNWREKARSAAATERSEGENSWGVWGALLAPPMGSRGEAPENFEFSGILGPWKWHFWLLIWNISLVKFCVSLNSEAQQSDTGQRNTKILVGMSG